MQKKEGNELFITCQAVKEFEENLQKVMDSEFSNRISSSREKLDKLKNIINENELWGFLKNQNILDTNDIKNFKTSLEKKFEELQEKLNEIAESGYHSETKLKVLERICEIFDQKILPLNPELYKNEEDIAKLVENGHAPGGKDVGKPKEKELGDAYIWLELIEKSKKERKSLHFITNDTKDDWIEQKKGKKIGLNSRLKSHFHKESDGQGIFVYTIEQFTRKFSNLYDDSTKNDFDAKMVSSELGGLYKRIVKYKEERPNPRKKQPIIAQPQATQRRREKQFRKENFVEKLVFAEEELRLKKLMQEAEEELRLKKLMQERALKTIIFKKPQKD